MSAAPDIFEQTLGPRADLTLVIEDQFVTQIIVNGRRPRIAIRDCDWGESDPDPEHDMFGQPYTPITWSGPIWKMGLSLHPPQKDTYTMANQTLRTIPLADLKVSKLNMRHGRKKPDISDILPSIRQHGLRQTLLVRQEGKHFGVVAGRRRLFALKQVAKETGVCPKVPCVVMQAGDDAAAMEASILENSARLPATEMEQYVAFGRLAEEGRSVGDIAEYFGVTDLTVKRVLALAGLIHPIRQLYVADDIDRETIRALTLATPEQQADWLRLFESEEERAPLGRSCKAWITGGNTITTDKALFDLGGYDGGVIADLFGEAGVFTCADAFWQVQSAALAAKVEAYLADGWRDVQVLERGHYFHRWDHRVVNKAKGGKVFVEVRHDGTVTFHEGYVTETEARRLEKAAKGEDPTTKATRPEMTKAMADYLAQHRHGAARATLLGHPATALRLMVAHALVGSELWNVRAHNHYTKTEAVTESLSGARAAMEMTQAGDAVAVLFKAHGIMAVRPNGDAYQLVQVFVALLGMDDAEVLQVLTHTIADTLVAGTPVVEALAVATQTDMAAYWTPDTAFFDLLRDKRAINAMVAEIASPATAEGCLTETAKVQKEIIAGRIADGGMDWRPRWMQVPPSAYVEGAGSAPVGAWERISSLFESDITEGANKGDDRAEPVAA